MSREELDSLIEQVRQVAYRLHVYLGVGLLEKVYENGLKHRLEKAGFKVDAQKAQLLNYLAITKQAAGLLINFGSYKFESRVVHAKT